MRQLEATPVNRYVAHKQHLLPIARLDDSVQVTRDIVALHATSPSGPYLSLSVRTRDFERQRLDDDLFERRALARTLCMRSTLHIVASDELPHFFQACLGREAQSQRRTVTDLLVQAGLCTPRQAGPLLKSLQRRVLSAVRRKGPSTVTEIVRAVPELQVKIRHSVDKSYAGEFSIGSRLIPAMCVQGLLVRARPRGGWRSNLHEYAILAEWLPWVDLRATTPAQARVWLARRYLRAFGPATLADIQWWTGFTKSETTEAVNALKADVVEVAIAGRAGAFLMLNEEVERLANLALPPAQGAFLLPGLDPYIMGYRDRTRFLAAKHHSKVFDRAGNAMPTVWVDGQVIGVWGQQKNGSVVYRCFESVPVETQKALEAERRQMEHFLNGEYVLPRTQTSYARTLK